MGGGRWRKLTAPFLLSHSDDDDDNNGKFVHIFGVLLLLLCVAYAMFRRMVGLCGIYAKSWRQTG